MKREQQQEEESGGEEPPVVQLGCHNCGLANLEKDVVLRANKGPPYIKCIRWM